MNPSRIATHSVYSSVRCPYFMVHKYSRTNRDSKRVLLPPHRTTILWKQTMQCYSPWLYVTLLKHMCTVYIIVHHNKKYIHTQTHSSVKYRYACQQLAKLKRLSDMLRQVAHNIVCMLDLLEPAFT